MKKFRCTVCGYVYEGDAAPEKCPICKAPASKFVEITESENGPLTFADEHVIGVAKGCDEEMIKDLNNHFMGECTEVGMYLAMSRQADREGYPEVAEAFKRYAWEEAEHAAKFAELLGDCVWDTKTNLQKRKDAEQGACEDKKRIATRAKALNLDAIHDTVHEMCKDEARHGKGFEGLYNRWNAQRLGRTSKPLLFYCNWLCGCQPFNTKAGLRRNLDKFCGLRRHFQMLCLYLRYKSKYCN